MLVLIVGEILERRPRVGQATRVASMCSDRASNHLRLVCLLLLLVVLHCHRVGRRYFEADPQLHCETIHQIFLFSLHFLDTSDARCLKEMSHGYGVGCGTSEGQENELLRAAIWVVKEALDSQEIDG